MKALLIAVVIAASSTIHLATAQAVSPGGSTFQESLQQNALGWPGYARDSYHDAIAPTRSQALQRIRWSTPVDLHPQYSGNDLLIHYGSPLITPEGTVVVTVKTGVAGGFRVEGHRSRSGLQIWSLPTDYALPPYDWTPSVGSTLTPSGSVAIPGAGGTIYLRSSPDFATGTVQQIAFYGLANYQANPTAYNNNVIIDTPITADSEGNLYFGFVVEGSTPIGLESGIARITPTGLGWWTPARVAANDPAIRKVVYNCAPALKRDRTAVYVAVTDVNGWGFGNGYLLELDSRTLAGIGRVRLKDAHATANDAYLPDDGTASPTVGPDGDVYFGVLENPFPSNNDRGWMLHFNGDLTITKTPGAFGWDDTASIVPRSAVPSYSGSSTYLVMTKYNNYAGVNTGDGHNKLAVLDPNATEIDPITGATVMNEVLTVLGVTPDPSNPGGVKEWCINSAAIDVAGKAALVGSEDGRLYRWDFNTNALTEAITLTSGIGEAYTPTLVGPDGTVYGVNNATLFAIGR